MTQIDDLRKILDYLVNADWDRASEKNEIGLSKFDTEDGHNLVEQKETWNFKQAQRALKICERHRKQLSKEQRGILDKIVIEELEDEIRNDKLKQAGTYPSSESPKSQRTGQASEIIEISNGLVKEYFKDQFDEPYVWMQTGEVVGIKSEKFRRMLAHAYYDETGDPPNKEQLRNAIEVLSYICDQGKTHELDVRVVSDGGTILIDLGRKDNSVLKISKNEIEEVMPDRPYFKRFKGLKEFRYDLLGTYQDCVALFQKWRFQDDDDLMLTIVLLGVDLIPGIPHVVDNVIGGQGAAKSTLTRTKKIIIDPSSVTDHSAGKYEDVVQLISHHYAINFDNVEEFSDWQAELICKGTTGLGFTKRRLYTDEDDFNINVRRKFFVNGLNRASVKPDYVDRSVFFLLERKHPWERMSEARISKEIEPTLPRIRGALLTAISKAISLREQVEKELSLQLPRMADADIWGEAISRALGIAPMEFHLAYVRKISSTQFDIIASDIVAQLVVQFMENREEWVGSATALFNVLKEMVEKNPLFPKDATRLSRAMNVIKETLIAAGIYYSEDRTSKERLKILTKIPTPICNTPIVASLASLASGTSLVQGLERIKGDSLQTLKNGPNDANDTNDAKSGIKLGKNKKYSVLRTFQCEGLIFKKDLIFGYPEDQYLKCYIDGGFLKEEETPPLPEKNDSHNRPDSSGEVEKSISTNVTNDFTNKPPNSVDGVLLDADHTVSKKEGGKEKIPPPEVIEQLNSIVRDVKEHFSVIEDKCEVDAYGNYRIVIKRPEENSQAGVISGYMKVIGFEQVSLDGISYLIYLKKIEDGKDSVSNKGGEHG